METTNATNHQDVENEFKRRSRRRIHQQNALDDGKYMGEAILSHALRKLAKAMRGLYQQKAAARKRKINTESIKKLKKLEATINQRSTLHGNPVTRIIALEQKILKNMANTICPISPETEGKLRHLLRREFDQLRGVNVLLHSMTYINAATEMGFLDLAAEMRNDYEETFKPAA